jgi:hypothetical protein
MVMGDSTGSVLTYTTEKIVNQFFTIETTRTHEKEVGLLLGWINIITTVTQPIHTAYTQPIYSSSLSSASAQDDPPRWYLSLRNNT